MTDEMVGDEAAAEAAEPDRPWAEAVPRLPGEGSRAWEALALYMEMGPGRSITLVARELGKSRAIIGRWCSSYSWVDRAREYDRHMHRIRQEGRERAAAAQAALWETRRLLSAESAYQAAQRMRAKALEMLEFPLAVRKQKADGTIVVVKPARWNMAVVGPLLRQAAELEWASLNAMTPPVNDLTEADRLAIEEAAAEYNRGIGAGPGPGGGEG